MKIAIDVPSLRKPRRFLAWLALAAMWLVVFAPVVSQTRLAAAPDGVESGWCGTHPPQVPSAPPSHDPAAPLCGYCDLLGHSPVLLGVTRVAALPPPTFWLPSVRFEAPHAPPRPLRISAPRGPPSFANA